VERSEPPVPYLAAIPVSEPPRRGRRRRWAIVGGGLVAIAVAAVVLLATVPVARATSESFAIDNPGSLTALSHSVTFPHSGTFSFGWATSNGGSVTFSVLDPLSVTLYQSAGSASGSGSILVTAGVAYSFEILDWLPEDVEVSGTLNYQAPLLGL
jgi:hypothetical protein